ncbi:hypothetical protein Cantr_01513 [Candida viswanathii]|uniref:Uncharacterized protein n=1 Tax=Candida viswanathii TaxID=5486 RepID=A0A367YIY9_9ASCO|nr:hypothetical protein Cantr_01513 [Candida viswanathii]
MNHITEEVTLGGLDYIIVVSYNHSVHKKAPITIYINQQGNQEVGDYIYTIANYSTYLHNLTNNDQIKLLNQLLAKRFDVPVFLNISGDRISAVSNIEIFRSIVDVVESNKVPRN